MADEDVLDPIATRASRAGGMPGRGERVPPARGGRPLLAAFASACLACAPAAAPGPSGSGGGDLASRYPGDVGIDRDPAVVWAEGFEEGSVPAVTARYDDWKNPPGMALLADVPPRSAGRSSLRMTAGPAANATDLYKRLPDRDELFARWYAKYEPGVEWHHTGVWIGGYAPPSSWPSPQAGLRPAGDDRFSVSVEPVFGVGGSVPRFDFYNYWMAMHSWMAQPTGSTAYYGNTLVHQSGFTVDEGRWVCLEVHVRLNPDPASGRGAVLEAWKDGALVQRFDDGGPMGYWIRDKFCPASADGVECTSYPAPADTVLDLRFRSTRALHLNAFWPQNYITSGPEGSVQYDDMVVASERVGCLR
jgi:hypothetical protein